VTWFPVSWTSGAFISSSMILPNSLSLASGGDIRDSGGVVYVLVSPVTPLSCLTLLTAQVLQHCSLGRLPRRRRSCLGSVKARVVVVERAFHSTSAFRRYIDVSTERGLGYRWPWSHSPRAYAFNGTLFGAWGRAICRLEQSKTHKCFRSFTLLGDSHKKHRLFI
jgi:hypothetical protein